MPLRLGAFLRNKWVVAAHIAGVSIGVNWYVKSLVRKEIAKRDAVPPPGQLGPAKASPGPGVSEPGPTSISTAAEKDAAGDSSDWSTIDNIAIFDQLAKKYDQEIRWEERTMFMPSKRKRLLEHAKGDVLEVSVGTGRNIPYYPDAQHLRSVTFLDASRAMLEQTVQAVDQHAEKFVRWEEPATETPPSMLKSLERMLERFFLGDRALKTRVEVPVEFYRLDASNLDMFPDNRFDTVVQTFGLCSIGTSHGPNPPPLHSDHDDGQCPDASHDTSHDSCHPVRALNEMARICKPDGRVLLLEHGLGWDLFNQWFLTTRASIVHYKKWGCWSNRDIRGLVEQSDLEIVDHKQWHFGTTHYIIAKPKPSLKGMSDVEKVVAVDVDRDDDVIGGQTTAPLLAKID